VEITVRRSRIGKCQAVARVDAALCAEAELISALVDRA
jgi:3-hydroxymyristoyl/3-hydroxydecanoyl-(acyl carrier protein) dehydratase